MKIVVAPDSFKGSLTAMEVAEAIERGIKKVDEKIEVIKAPMADGGEGTVQSLVDATGGKIIETFVSDPLLRRIKAFYGILGDNKTAVIEMAAASGLPLLREDERNPLKTTTYGTGELILDALNRGCRNIIIGIGGSATNDGGEGMAKALGVEFTDRDGKDIGFGGGSLYKLYKIDLSKIDKRIYECNISAACDVDNPLCGERGASFVFGPQKGASPKDVKILDNNLRHYGEMIEKTLGKKIINYEGAGAAGGLGAGLLVFLNAELKRGVEIVIETTGLEKKIKDADLVITGEGMIDFQTAFGKTPYGVVQVASKYGVPVIAIAGGIGKDANTLYNKGFKSIFSIVDRPMSLNEAMENGSMLLEDTAERIMRALKINLK
ncbi:MAG TPA: glycerate kinase [Clostridiaceae bacterium]|jgi:glycerate kinase|nr:glycerate kinase [Clostridiaceae bacterium]HBF77649.1 glycerate kinase [Clostridiaceae bacterium]HBG39217.1 glycerate kinase [Clostridiaceae bacterium]HBN28612.1 glycerate kinase [Clostridiaceae bacterium]HBX47633.1 glycerate kinase [Clostridiaceae bacterium]